MNKNFLFLSLGCAMLLTGCVKDEPNAYFIKLFAEGFTPDNSAKAAVFEDKTYWVDGDDVWINGYKYDVTVTGAGEAVASGVHQESENAIYRAVYPASVHNGPVTANEVTIKVPKQYYYVEDASGRQVLDGLPMVAYSATEPTETTGLQFKHVTAAITVRVKNARSESINLDRIMLINSDYQLSGNVTFDISGAASGSTLSVAPNKTGVADTVMIVFTELKRVCLAPNASLDVQIPILPVGGDSDPQNNSDFTIKVYGHKEGSNYKYNRSTGSRNNSIARGCLGYAVAKYEDNPATTTTSDLFPQEENTVTVNGQSVTKNFYKISTPDELINLSSALDSGWAKSGGSGNYQKENYEIVNDIDLHGSTMTPVHYYNNGAASEEDRVYFYGGGNTISNYVESSVGENEPNCCGFFGRTGGDYITVTDLTLDNAEYQFSHIKQKTISYDDNSSTAVGGLFAVVDKKGIEIVNCTIQNIKIGATGTNVYDPKQTDFYASGIVGLVATGVKIVNCYVGTVEVNNTESSTSTLVDQFGAAVGRIDVGLKSSENSYQDIKTRLGAAFVEDSVPTTIIQNFRYEQGATPMVFNAEVKNIRYGGVVGNVSRGGILKIISCHANHNVEFNKDPLTEMFVSGLVGCLRNSSAHKMGFYMSSDCTITGKIVNNALSTYKANSKEINKYYCYGPSAYRLSHNGEPSATECTNTLYIDPSSTANTAFKNPSQTFSSLAAL